MKRNLSFVLVFVMLAALAAGCASGGAPTPAPGEASPAGDTQTPAGAEQNNDADGPAPITFTVFTPSSEPPQNNSPILQEVAKVTGVTLDFQSAPGMASERLSIMLASKDYTDVVIMPRDTLFYQYLASGDMLDLKPLLQEHAPTVYHIYDAPQNGSLVERFSDDQGRLLYLTNDLEVLRDGETAPLNLMAPDYVIPNNEFTWHPTLHVLFPDVQNLWGQEIDSMDELYEVLKAYRESNPDPRYYPMSTSSELGGDLIWAALSMNRWKVLSYGVYGGVYTTQDDVNYQYAFKVPVVLDFMKEMNRFYREGLIDQEGPIQTSERLLEKMNAGSAFSVICRAGEFLYDANANLFASADTADQMYIPQKLLAEGISDQWQANYAYTGHNAILLPNKNKDPVRYAQFMEWMYSDEGLILTGWGFEGEDYIIDANGNRDISEEINAKMEEDPEYSWKRGLGAAMDLLHVMAFTTDGQRAAWFSAPFYMTGESWDPRDRAVAASDFEWHGNWAGTWWKDYDEVDIYADAQSDESKALAQAQSLVNDAVAKMIMAGSEQEVERIYQETVDQMNTAGIEKWEKMITDTIAARRAG